MILLRTVRKQPKTCAACPRVISRGSFYARVVLHKTAGYQRKTVLCLECGERLLHLRVSAHT